MGRYVLKRLLVALPALVIASVMVFTLPRLLPGDVVVLMLEEKAYGRDIAELRAKLGLDRPIYVQYFEWAGRVLRGDLGDSLWTKRPILAELATRLPVTAELGAFAIAFAIVIGVPIGILAAVRADALADYVVRSAAIIGLSVPGFWLATLVIIVPAVWWGWTPHLHFVDFAADPRGHFLQFLLPGFLLGVASAAAIMRLTRGMLLEVLRQDYIRTAWAKGLSERRVVVKHSLKNAVIPVVTILGLQIAQILGGTVIFEQIFGLPGLGRFLFDAITQRDYPVIQGINLLIVSMVVVINLGVDALYAFLDPRIRF